jgi:thiol-disulfide isomerase/thioredoxin
MRNTKKLRQSGGAKKKDLEVKTEADIPKLKTALDAMKKAGPAAIVLIYVGAEEWCGPCQRYRPVWDEYKNTAGRKIPMIHVDHKMMEKSPLSNVKVSGFPTNGVYSPHDESFSPIENIHDKQAMTTLLKTDPSKLMRNKPEDEDEESVILTPSNRAKLNESGRKAVEAKNDPIPDMNSDASPPDIKGDNMANAPNGKLSGNLTNALSAKPAKGGALFRTLLRAVKGLGRPTRRAKKGSRTTLKR